MQVCLKTPAPIEAREMALRIDSIKWKEPNTLELRPGDIEEFQTALKECRLMKRRIGLMAKGVMVRAILFGSALLAAVSFMIFEWL
jgi:hypothetical protein